MLIGSFITGLGIMSLSFLNNIYMFYASILLVSLDRAWPWEYHAPGRWCSGSGGCGAAPWESVAAAPC